MVSVLNGYGYERSMRTSESGGGFRSSAESKGQAGGLTYGAGTMALVWIPLEGRHFRRDVELGMFESSPHRPDSG